MIYLASPYSGTPAEHAERFVRTQAFVAYWFRLGVPLISPIVYCHQLAHDHELPGDAAFWQFLNEELIQRSSEMWVLTLPGWQESIGVQREIEQAHNLSLTITYKEPLPW